MVRSRAGGSRCDYRVCLIFKNEPAFEIEVNADGRAMALRLAEDAARLNGWESAVCGYEITPLRRQRGEI